MSSKQYYVASLWDNQWVPVSDELKSQILDSELTLIKEENNASLYRFNNVGTEYTVLYSTLQHVSYINHITDFSYRVEVMINGVYVPAKTHQEQALIKYVITKERNIEVPHTNGGLFRATFSTLDNDHFQYITENDYTVHMRRIAIL
jgi:hypothetical protein